MSESLLTLKEVSKRYGDQKVLHDINLTIMRGEIISLLGVNGAGKTTLSSIIATLHPATEGEILYNETSIYKILPEFRAKIGYCPQKPNLNPYFTLEQNLHFSARFYGIPDDVAHTRITKLVKQFELERFLSKRAAVLSGGYKQRFMIVRSLLHNPEFIIFDEPTVGLDPQVRRTLWDYIKELRNEGITILLTTHYLDEAENLSDRVCILDKGIIRLIDTPEHLMEQFKSENLEDVFIALTKKEDHE